MLYYQSVSAQTFEKCKHQWRTMEREKTRLRLSPDCFQPIIGERGEIWSLINPVSSRFVSDWRRMSSHPLISGGEDPGPVQV